MEADVRIALMAEGQYGVFSRRQASACGYSSDVIDGRLASGVWVREFRGVYRVAGSPASEHSRVMAAVLAAGCGACASHLTAAELWRFEGTKAGFVEVAVPDRRDVHLPQVVVHRPRQLAIKDRTQIGAIAFTTPTRTILDVASVLNPLQLELALDDALRRRLVRVRPLLARVTGMPPQGRRGIPILRTLVADRTGDARSESSLETLFLRLIARTRLPRPSQQHTVTRDDGSFVARVDFAYASSRIAIEIDGYAFHEGRQRWDRDRARQNDLIDEGWTVLRFTKTDIEGRQISVIASIRKALDRASLFGLDRPSGRRTSQPKSQRR